MKIVSILFILSLVFMIQPQYDMGFEVSVKNPNGGEVWYCGLTYAINWTTKGGTSPIYVWINYSTTGNSGPWYEINNGSYSHKNDGTEDWVIPNIESTHCYIQITARESSSPAKEVSDISDNKFTITKVKISVSVLKPNGGEIWFIDEKYDIKWTAKGGVGSLSVTIEYSNVSHSGPYVSIVKNYSNTGSYTWLVQTEPSDTCYIRITAYDKLKNNASDVSNSSFRIMEKPPPLDIKINTPQGSENFTAGTKCVINWTYQGGIDILTVKLEYKTSVTGRPKPIADNLPPKPSEYQWTVPSEKSTDCYIQITLTDSAQPNEPAENLSKNFTIWPPPDTQKPVIKHTPVDWWTEGISIPINVMIIDNVNVSTAKLYYRKSGTLPYVDITMVSNNSHYTAEIPSSIVTLVGVEYYLMAEDTAEPPNVATSPMNNPEIEPYVIKVYPRFGTIRGEVVENPNNPVENAVITLVYSDNSSSVATTSTDSNGMFEIRELSFTTYNLTISKKNYTEIIMAGIELKRTEPIKNLGVIKLSKIAGIIIGKVYDANANIPIYDAKVKAVLIDGTWEKIVSTNTDGEFKIENTPLGTFEIEALKEGYNKVVVKTKLTISNRQKNVGILKLSPISTDDEAFPWKDIMIYLIISVVIISVLIIAISTISKTLKKTEKPPGLEYRGYVQPPVPVTRKVQPQEEKPPQPPPGEKIDLKEELQRLKELRDSGVISNEEYEFTKRGLLKKFGEGS